MNRVIKFRAWDIRYKEMRGVMDVKWFNNGNIRVNATENDENYEPLMHMKEYKGEELKEFELMQYIGRNDKNGKEIYEGDIVKALNRAYDNSDDKEEYFEHFEVTYAAGCFMFGNWNALEFFCRFTYIEVAGNIYEKGDSNEQK